MKRNRILAASTVAILSLSMAACANKEEDENASIVNIEKGVAPPMATPEGAVVIDDLGSMTGIEGATPEAREAVEEAQQQVDSEDTSTPTVTPTEGDMNGPEE